MEYKGFFIHKYVLSIIYGEILICLAHDFFFNLKWFPTKMIDFHSSLHDHVFTLDFFSLQNSHHLNTSWALIGVNRKHVGFART